MPILSTDWYKYIVENTKYLLKKTEHNTSCIEGYTAYFDTPNGRPQYISINYIFDELEYMKKLAFGTFQVDIENLLKMKHIFYQKLRVQPSEIENMPYYEYEYTVSNLKEWLEKEKEAHEKEREESDGKYNQQTMKRESDSMMKKYGINPNNLKNNSTPKMPNLGSMKLPKI